jgi:hypothetical protein
VRRVVQGKRDAFWSPSLACDNSSAVNSGPMVRRALAGGRRGAAAARNSEAIHLLERAWNW